MTATETTLEIPTKTLELYGKNGNLRNPTKAYPKATIIPLEVEMIKDFGDGVIVWKFAGYKDIEPEKYWVYHHHRNGKIGSGGECTSQEAAFDRAARTLVWREYHEKKSEMYREFREELDRLEEEYKGRI